MATALMAAFDRHPWCPPGETGNANEDPRLV